MKNVEVLWLLKHGRFGEFLACPGYPECKNTKPIVEELDVPCPKCGETIVAKEKQKRKKILWMLAIIQNVIL